MTRTPPIPVMRALRKEVGFGCPVQDCGNPYLFWHHFDPPWSELHHHNPEGMIALCDEHHRKADAGAFTREQLIALKNNGYNKDPEGRFDWMRNSILAVVGGSYYLDPNIILKYKGEKIIWFTKDDDGNFLLNISMTTSKNGLRFTMIENFWNILAHPKDVLCPPSGRKIHVSYTNKDYIKVEFYDIGNVDEFFQKFKIEPHPLFTLNYPITIVEVKFSDGDANFVFDSNGSYTSRGIIKGLWAEKGPCIISIA